MKSFSFKESLNSSIKTSILILKLVIPMYILAEILFFYNILSYFTFIIEPFTSIIGLPPEASLSMLSGMFLSEYAAVAFAAPLNLNPQQWTTLAVFVGVCHALVVEGLIMRKIGISQKYSYLLRISFGFFLSYLTFILPSDWFSSGFVLFEQTNNIKKEYLSIFELLKSSIYDSFILTINIILLVTILIFSIDFLKTRSFIDPSNNKFSKWFCICVGYILGVTYGAGILIKEVENGSMNKSDIFFISTFLLICHAIIEDTLLFVILGADFTMVVIIRTISAIFISYFMLFFYQKNTDKKLIKPY